MLKTTDEYKKLSITETLKELQTDKDRGLSQDEVKKRLSAHGYNEVPRKSNLPFIGYSGASGVRSPG
jgi:H+-transporting ATPase